MHRLIFATEVLVDGIIAKPTFSDCTTEHVVRLLVIPEMNKYRYI